MGLGVVGGWGAFAQALCTRVADDHPHVRAWESGPEPAGIRALVIRSCSPDATRRRCPRWKGEGHCFQGHTPQREMPNRRMETGIWAKAISSQSRRSTGEHKPIRLALLLSNYEEPSSPERPRNPAREKHLDPFLGLIVTGRTGLLVSHRPKEDSWIG